MFQYFLKYLCLSLSNAQGYIRGKTEDLYSATRQAMGKYVKKVQNEKYLLFLRNDTFRVEEAEKTEEFDHWAKIPISGVWGPRDTFWSR